MDMAVQLVISRSHLGDGTGNGILTTAAMPVKVLRWTRAMPRMLQLPCAAIALELPDCVLRGVQLVGFPEQVQRRPHLLQLHIQPAGAGTLPVECFNAAGALAAAHAQAVSLDGPDFVAVWTLCGP